MGGVAILTFDGETPRARLALLLDHFSELEDEREPWRVMYPLKEVLLLVVCATIASCDDFDDIVAWGEHHLDFLRRFSEFHQGIPCERWSAGSNRPCPAAAAQAEHPRQVFLVGKAVRQGNLCNRVVGLGKQAASHVRRDIASSI